MTPQTPTSQAMKLLRTHGIARSRDLERGGISRTQLRRLTVQGTIVRVGRGLYSLPDAAVSERRHLAEASLAIPGGVICLLSALRFHGLTTQNPFEIWIAIPRKAWRPRRTRPPLRLVHVSEKSLRDGVEKHEVDGVPVQVFSPARTVADCFKFRNKIGSDVAVEALRAYRRQHPRGLDELWRFAEANRVARVLRPYIEALG